MLNSPHRNKRDKKAHASIFDRSVAVSRSERVADTQNRYFDQTGKELTEEEYLEIERDIKMRPKEKRKLIFRRAD